MHILSLNVCFHSHVCVFGVLKENFVASEYCCQKKSLLYYLSNAAYVSKHNIFFSSTHTNSIRLFLCVSERFIMRIIKYFNEKAEKNRIRVRRCRQKKKNRLNHQNQVYERMFSKSDVLIEQCLSNECSENSCSNVGVSNGLEDMITFETKLKCWATNHHISARAISDLLKILIFAGFTFLPKDSRTFMKTPSNVPIKVLSNGKMWYNGIEKCLKNVLSNISRDVCITLDFNFDGIPVFKSSNLQFWPILMAIQGDFFRYLQTKF